MAPSRPTSHDLQQRGIGYSSSLDNFYTETSYTRVGFARVKGGGSVFGWIWKRKWLVLGEQTLAIHTSKTSQQQTVILLRDLSKIERTDLKPYCLLLEAKHKRYYLSLKNDEEVYGWQDDLYTRSPLTGVNNPTNFVHKVHVGFDPVSGTFTGLPEQWSKLLAKSAVPRKDYAKDPQAVLDVLEFYTDHQKRELEDMGRFHASTSLGGTSRTNSPTNAPNTMPSISGLIRPPQIHKRHGGSPSQHRSEDVNLASAPVLIPESTSDSHVSLPPTPPSFFLENDSSQSFNFSIRHHIPNTYPEDDHNPMDRNSRVWTSEHEIGYEGGSRRGDVDVTGRPTKSALTDTSYALFVPTAAAQLPIHDATVSRTSPDAELAFDETENVYTPPATPLPIPHVRGTQIRPRYGMDTSTKGGSSLQAPRARRREPKDDGLKAPPVQPKESFPPAGSQGRPRRPTPPLVDRSASRPAPVQAIPINAIEAPLNDPLRGVIPENIEAIVERLTLVFANIHQYKRLLSCRDSEAQQLLDAFQMLLDTPFLGAKFRRSLLVATQRLSKGAGLYPTCYHMKEVELASEDPVAAGGFADIYKGRLQGQTVCLKVIRFYQTSDVNSFLKHFSAEAILWSQLLHPNLLPIYGLYRYKARLCLISPWMEHGDINRFLQTHPDVNRTLLVSDVASGVAYLHENEIIHGDLKGQNVMINESGRACLADFGLSSVSDKSILNWTSNSSAASKGGTTRYQAPELFDIEGDDVVHNTKASDVYAFACVAYEIFTGNKPFFEIRDEAVILKIIQGAQPSLPPASSTAWGTWGLTKPLWSLMQACWSRDPPLRPTIHHVVSQDALKKCLESDRRPVRNANTIPPSSFRDTRADLPSFIDIEYLLDAIDKPTEAQGRRDI